MAILQPLVDLAEICYLKGVRHIVLSPGSRSAALTLAFSRHQGFEMQVVMDERAAGFIALGIAQQTGVPVVLLCTSGSAAYNLAPAIAEAFFQQIPLLVLTADRPKEWTHQYDGQTIYQYEIYGKHVKKSLELPGDYSHKDSVWAINRIVNEGLDLAGHLPFGPVHINVPIREPFYPAAEEALMASPDVRVIHQIETQLQLGSETWNTLIGEWEDAPKILIVGGQHPVSERLNSVLAKITEEFEVPVVGDSVANLSGSEQFIYHQDLILSGKQANSDLVPDLLITYGLSLMSKELKIFLRNNRPTIHWHISSDGVWADPLQSVTHHIGLDAVYFFETFFEKVDYQLFVQNSELDNDSAYLEKWKGLDRGVARKIADYLKNQDTLTDLVAIDTLLDHIGTTSQLHIGNSMPIRYVNALGKTDGFAGLFCNRGTSGIDGSLSSAIGAALVNDQPTIALLGDVSFLYDRNGLLIESLPQNLKIVVINNGGGNIFRMIDGPANQPELERFFETKHSFSAKRTAEDASIRYLSIEFLNDLIPTIQEFNAYKGSVLLEVFTNPAENTKVWKGLKQYVKGD